MVELFQAVYFGAVGDKTPVTRVLIFENHAADSAVDQSHGAHEARLNICDQYKILKIVLLVTFSLIVLKVKVS